MPKSISQISARLKAELTSITGEELAVARALTKAIISCGFRGKRKERIVSQCVCFACRKWDPCMTRLYLGLASIPKVLIPKRFLLESNRNRGNRFLLIPESILTYYLDVFNFSPFL